MPRLRNANACNEAASRAVAWLHTHFDNEEQWEARTHPLVTYHKVPYLLAVAGRVEECQRALIWIKANVLTDKGDLRATPLEDRKADSPLPGARVREKSWIALAAHLMGRYDVSLPVARRLVGQQGGSTGGVYDSASEGIPEATANVRTTACAGLVFQTVGMTREARLAARLLTRVMSEQTNGTRFHTRVDTLGRVVRDFPKSEENVYVLSRARARTDLSLLGIPIIFLARMHRVTGEMEWLECAMDYCVFAQSYGPQARCGMAGGTLAWGAALLYGITRRRLYYDMAEEIAQSWVKRQNDDGSWSPEVEALPDIIEAQ